jgi:hypothetical protein
VVAESAAALASYLTAWREQSEDERGNAEEHCSCLFWRAVDRVEYVMMDARLRRFDLIYGPEPTTSADEKRNRERPAADLEIDTSASS